MILVLLGTFPMDFKRPLIEIEKLLKVGIIKDEVIVQSGHTPFQSEYMKIIPFIPINELLELYKKADLIISQGGTGSIIKGVRLGKKIILIPRLFKLNEHVDDHQTELALEMGKNGYVLPWFEDDSLEELLEKVKIFTPKVFQSDNSKISEFLINYIDSI